MVTVSHIVKNIVKDRPFLQETMAKEIISYGNLAEQLLPKIEKEIGKKVKHSAVVMALRRYADELSGKYNKMKKFNYESELVLKTNICDFTVRKSHSLLSKIRLIYNLVDFGKGDFLNISLGNYEVSIIFSDKYKKKMNEFLKGEKILNKEENLVALTFTFSDDFFHTPGVIFMISRLLALENINICEAISTMTEFTLILSKKDSMKAYEVLEEFIEKGKI